MKDALGMSEGDISKVRLDFSKFYQKEKHAVCVHWNILMEVEIFVDFGGVEQRRIGFFSGGNNS